MKSDASGAHRYPMSAQAWCEQPWAFKECQTTCNKYGYHTSPPCQSSMMSNSYCGPDIWTPSEAGGRLSPTESCENCLFEQHKWPLRPGDSQCKMKSDASGAHRYPMSAQAWCEQPWAFKECQTTCNKYGYHTSPPCQTNEKNTTEIIV